MHADAQSMERTPKDEIEGSTMPKAAKGHSNHLVDIHAHLSLTVSAKGYIYVIAYPTGQRDMPPTPEVAQRVSLVRRIKVGRYLKAQQCRDADSHIGIAREVAVELNAIAIECHQNFPTGEQRRIVEHAADEIDTDIVADDHLLEHTYYNKVYPKGKHLPRDVQRFAYLGYKISGADDRAGKENWEETNVERIVQQTVHRLHLAPVHVDGIGDAFESKEGDTGRKEDIPRLEVLTNGTGYHPGEEVGIFEIGQKA